MKNLNMIFPITAILLLFYSQTLFSQLPNDECVNSINISTAFTEECEMIGPYEQGGATVGMIEPPLPNCFADAYNGTSWFTFTVPINVANGLPSDFIISTGAYADCTNNPLSGNADTQIAIYENDCPGGDDTPIACNEDFSGEPPYISSVQTTLTPGNQYYIMVETFGQQLEGEFCFYIQPLVDFSYSGTLNCINCGDNVCNGILGEMFSTCSQDCPCDAGFVSLSINNGLPFPSLNYTAYCGNEVDSDLHGLFIPFAIGASNLMLDSDNVTFLNSNIYSTVGEIYNYSNIESPSPLIGSATRSPLLLFLNPADLANVENGKSIILTFTDATGCCSISETISVNLDINSCTTNQILGCIDTNSCNYNPAATIDDISCIYIDCVGVCGGSVGPGSACTDLNGNEAIYNTDCSCIVLPIWQL